MSRNWLRSLNPSLFEALIAASSALLLATNCGGLPQHARPSGGRVDPSSVDRSNTIRYRKLTKADFQGAQPPAHLAEHAHQLGALTCANIITAEGAGFEIAEEPSADGKSTYVGRLTGLAFIAEMDRNCSWWNDAEQGHPEPYVLQHEQIHFALTEIAARKQTQKAKELVADLRITGPSAERVREKLQKTVTDMIDRAGNELLQENKRFDKETSLVYAPERQDQWYERAMQDLKSLPQ